MKVRITLGKLLQLPLQDPFPPRDPLFCGNPLPPRPRGNLLLFPVAGWDLLSLLKL
jgi:hypothetical protein